MLVFVVLREKSEAFYRQKDGATTQVPEAIVSCSYVPDTAGIYLGNSQKLKHLPWKRPRQVNTPLAGLSNPLPLPDLCVGCGGDRLRTVDTYSITRAKASLIWIPTKHRTMYCRLWRRVSTLMSRMVGRVETFSPWIPCLRIINLYPSPKQLGMQKSCHKRARYACHPSSSRQCRITLLRNFHQI